MEKNSEKDPRVVSFGKRVAEARKSAGLTQAEVTRMLEAENVRVPATAIAKIETGTRPTSVTELLGLAQVLGVDVGELVGTVSPEAAARADTSNRHLRWISKAVEARDELKLATVAYKSAYVQMSNSAHDYQQAHGSYPPGLEHELPADPVEVVAAESARWPYQAPARPGDERHGERQEEA